MLLAQSIMNHAEDIQRGADKLVVDTYIAIARMVVIQTPLWSGQAKLNWTASIGLKRPPKRFVNVQRTNVRLRKDSKTGGKKVSGGRQGNRSNILYDPRTAMTARATSLSAIESVASSYKHPIAPSNALPRNFDVRRKSVGIRSTPALYLRNSLDYIGDLWDGTNRKNPRTLDSTLDFGVRTIQNRKLLRR